MSTLERGFKSWCERRAASLRAELRLSPAAPIEIATVARHLRVKLLTPKDIAGLDATDLNQLLRRDAESWSAVTLEVTGRTVIIYNSTHSRGRQASDISHELAHLLLEHRSATLVLSPDVPFLLRTFSAKQEDEANWLGWTLLLPRVALIQARALRKSIGTIASEYGVSEPLVRFRLQRTGVERQLARTR